jgi:hypothetical protein
MILMILFLSLLFSDQAFQTLHVQRERPATFGRELVGRQRFAVDDAIDDRDIPVTVIPSVRNLTMYVIRRRCLESLRNR